MDDGLRVEVRITKNGVEVSRFCWTQPSDARPCADMALQLVPSREPVVGPTGITRAVDRWVADMQRRGIKPKSSDLFVRRVRACVAYNGWSEPEEMTYAGAAEWLGAMLKGGWAGTTHDQAISALQGFTRYLVKVDALSSDPWKALDRRGDTGKVGGRALTHAEIQAMVAVGYAASAVDRRSKAPRGLYYGFLSLTGLRYSEGEACRWGDLDLDGEVPALWSNPEWSKNGKRERVVLASQLRARLDEWRKCVPCDRDALVFPHIPNRMTFAKDRAAAGVPEVDGQGRPVGFHSFRRGFATMLYDAGVNDAVIVRLMRHAHGITQARYIDPDPAAEVAAVESLPGIFPQILCESQLPKYRGVTNAKREQIGEKCSSPVANAKKGRYVAPATFGSHDTTTPDPVPPLERRTLSPQAPGSGVGLSGEHRPGHQASAARRERSSDPSRDGNANRLGPQMPICALQMNRVLNLLAEAHAGLVAIAGRLGQTEVRHGEGEGEG